MMPRGVGLALERAATRFRRIKPHRVLTTVITVLRKAQASEVAA